MALRFSPNRGAAAFSLNSMVRGPAGPSGVRAIDEPTVITASSATVAALTTTIAIQRVAPSTTAIQLPTVAAQDGIPLTIVDWSSSVTDHAITITPAGAEKIMLESNLVIYSTASALTSVTLYPSEDLSGWYAEPSIAKLANATLSSPTIDGSVSGTVSFNSGKPWADVTAFSSLVVGTDWTAAIYAAMDVVDALGGGIVYFPPGLYATYAGIDATGYPNVTFKGAGISLSGLWTSNRDVTTITIGSSFSGITDMVIFGKGTNSDAGTFGALSTSHGVVLGAAAVGAFLSRVYIWGGYYPLKVLAPDARLDYVLAREGYGPTNLYVANCAGVRIENSSVDQAFPVSNVSLIAPGGIAAWGSGEVVSAGDIRTRSGYVIQCRVGGTTGASAPTLANYQVDISDGATVKWRLARPTVFYGINLDTGASEFLATKVDMSGTYESCIRQSNTLGGTAPFLNKLHQCILSGADLFGVDIRAGGRFVITDSHIYGTLRLDTSAGIYADTLGTGGNIASNCHILGHNNGILDGKGTGSQWNSCDISNCGSNALYVSANVSNVTAIGGNWSVANTNAYTIDAGTGDYITIVGVNGGGLPVVNAATGVNNCLPALNTSLMTLGGVETVTGAKTFGSAGAVGKLKIAGTTSGTTILDAAAVASGTLTLPATTDRLVALSTTDTLENKTLTAPTINGGTVGALTSFGVRSTGAAFDLKLANTEVLTANRTLAIATLDANRTLALGGNISIDANFVLSGASAFTGTLTGVTAVTFPTSGLLATTSNKLSAFAPTTFAELASVISDALIRQVISLNSGGASGAFALATGATGYVGPSGGGAGTAAQQAVAPMAGTFKNLYVKVVAPGSAPGGSETYIATLRVNGSDTALTCTITGAATSASDTSNSVSVSAGDSWQIKIVSSAGATTGAYFALGVEFDNS